MEKETTLIEKTFEKIENYVVSAVQLYQLKAANAIINTLVGGINKLIVLGIILFISIPLELALAWWLGDILGKTYLGLLSVTGFNLIVGVVILVSRKKYILQPLKESIIRSLITKHDHTE